MADTTKPAIGVCPFCGAAVGFKQYEGGKACPQCKRHVTRESTKAK